MTPTDIRAALARLGLTQMEAARRLGVAPQTVRRWIAGKSAVPRPVEMLLEAWEAHPELMRAA